MIGLILLNFKMRQAITAKRLCFLLDLISMLVMPLIFENTAHLIINGLFVATISMTPLLVSQKLKEFKALDRIMTCTVSVNQMVTSSHGALLLGMEVAVIPVLIGNVMPVLFLGHSARFYFYTFMIALLLSVLLVAIGYLNSLLEKGLLR